MSGAIRIALGSDGHNNQDDDQQNDDDPQQIETDSLPSRNLLVDDLRLRGGTVELTTLEQRNGGLSPRDIEPQLLGNSLHFGLLERRADRLSLREGTLGSLGQRLVHRTR